MQKKIKLTLILFYVFGLLFVSDASSQILNIERGKIKRDTVNHFNFKLTAGLSVFNRSAAEDSPVNLFGYNVDMNALYYPKEHAYVLVGRFDYLRINDNDFLNFGFVHSRINFFRERKVNYDAYAQYSYDNFRGLDPRIIGGGNVRVKLLENDNISLVVATGLLLENERWTNQITDEVVEVNFLKNSNYISFRYSVNEYLDINSINYYQVGYDSEISNPRHRISSITNINTKISKHFSLTNSMEINFEDRPIVPITRLIFSFRTGISIDL